MADRVGQQLGNYRLVRVLGQGGFAEVYLSQHIHLGTQAAIKLLHAQLAEAEEVEKFRAEARTIATLRHPNIVRLLDFGVEGGTPYLIMDYAPGGTLRQRHPKGQPVPPPLVISYVKQTASALQYAHDQRLVHRDIKPENLLLGPNNEVLLTDFGIAIEAQTTLQDRTMGVAGTSAYAAPEQLQGHPRPASDQYSLGIMVYEWLSGTRPFQGTAIELVSQHMLKPPMSLRQLLPSISPALDEVVLTALEKDSQQRFSSVTAFATALENALKSAPQPATSSPIIIAPAPVVALPRQSGTPTPNLPPGSPPPNTSPAWGGRPPPGTAAPVPLSTWQTGAPAQPFPPPPSSNAPPKPSGSFGGPITTPKQPDPFASPHRKKILFGGLAILVVLAGIIAYFALSGSGGTTPTTTTNPKLLYQASLTQKLPNWECSKEPRSACTFQSDGYHIQPPNDSSFGFFLSDPVFTDFILEVKAIFKNGDPKKAALLISFRASQNNKQANYTFLLEESGNYLLLAFDNNGKVSTLLDRTPSSAIKTGANQSNGLKLTINGPQFSISINGQQVNERSDATYKSGYIGLGAFGQGTEAVFSNLLITKP